MGVHRARELEEPRKEAYDSTGLRAKHLLITRASVRVAGKLACSKQIPRPTKQKTSKRGADWLRFAFNIELLSDSRRSAEHRFAPTTAACWVAWWSVMPGLVMRIPAAFVMSREWREFEALEPYSGALCVSAEPLCGA